MSEPSSVDNEIIRSLLGCLQVTPSSIPPTYLIPMQGPFRIQSAILSQLSCGKPGSIGVIPFNQEELSSKICRIGSSFGLSSNGRDNVPPTSSDMALSMPIRSI